MRHSAVVWGAATLAMLAGCSEAEAPTAESSGWFAEGMDVPFELQDAETRDAIARMVGYWPNTELTTHDGQKVRFYDDLVEGKNVLISFMYTRCDGI